MDIIERARELRRTIEENAQNMADDVAVENVELFHEWTVDDTYEKGFRVRHNGVLYTVLQNHVSQSDWEPENTPSLYAKVLAGQDGTVGEWEQPDSTNPYKKGDTVTHNGKTWESLIDGNVWEPGVVGTEALWAEVA